MEDRIIGLECDLENKEGDVEVMENDHKDYDRAILENANIAEKAFRAGANSGKCIHHKLGNADDAADRARFDSSITRAWLNHKIEAML